MPASSWLNEKIVSFFDGLFGPTRSDPTVRLPIVQAGIGADITTPASTYQLLRSLYYNNGAYRERATDLSALGLTDVDTKGLRTIQHALVEFYVATVWPGSLPAALPLVFPDSTPEDRRANQARAIHRIWNWSNWDANKQLFVRKQSMLGDAFIYVASRETITPEDQQTVTDRVYFHLLEPEHVTDFDVDTRGFLTYVRMDTPHQDRDTGERGVVIEVWWKGKDQYRRWYATRDQYALNEFGTLVADDSMTGDYGIDFVPVVQAKHVDTGEKRGMAPIVPVIEKMDEVNAKATRYSSRLYRHGKPDLILEGAGGQTVGTFQPPPPVNQSDVQEVDMAGEKVITAPPGYTVRQAIAGVDFAAHLSGVAADFEHIRESDVPELVYYLIGSLAGSGASGAAIRKILTPAVAKAEEARGNAEAALARADMMAMSIAQYAEMDGFSPDEIGQYEDNDGTGFAHSFAARDVIPATTEEEADTLKTRVDAAKVLFDMGVDAADACEQAGLPASFVTKLREPATGAEPLEQ